MLRGSLCPLLCFVVRVDELRFRNMLSACTVWQENGCPSVALSVV